MDTQRQSATRQAPPWITLKREVNAPVATVWDLWTTAAGIESWWAPDGFTVTVQQLDLRVGGDVVYTMTATAPEQIAFLRDAGLPLTTVARKTFTEIAAGQRLGYRSQVDYVPGISPYEHVTEIRLRAIPDGTHVTQIMQPMHDEEWTQRLIQGRENELANLARVAARHAADGQAPEHPQSGTPPIPITGIHTIAIPVADQGRALDFYRQAFDFEVRRDAPFGDGRWIEIAPPGATTSIALLQARPGTAAGVDTGLRLTTPDVAAAHAALIALGVDVDATILRMGDMVPPMFAFRDPDGNRLVLVERR